MGRTVPSYRLASERERRKWKIFREELDKSERNMFDEMMDISRLYNVAGLCSCKPVLLHPILMSIIFEHYKQLNKIHNQLQESNYILSEKMSQLCEMDGITV